jgi:hypothetical protein
VKIGNLLQCTLNSLVTYLLSHPSFIHPHSYSFIRPFTYHPFIPHLFIHASIHSSDHFTIPTHSFLPPIHPSFIHPRTYFIHLTIFTLPTLSFFFCFYSFFYFYFTLSNFAIHPSCIPEYIDHPFKDDIHPSIHLSIQCHPLTLDTHSCDWSSPVPRDKSLVSHFG